MLRVHHDGGVDDDDDDDGVSGIDSFSFRRFMSGKKFGVDGERSPLDSQGLPCRCLPPLPLPLLLLRPLPPLSSDTALSIDIDMGDVGGGSSVSACAPA